MHSSNACSVISTLLFTFLLASTPVAIAAPGDLDPTFGNNGKVQISMGDEDFARAVIAQADGKIIVGGSTKPRGSSLDDFALLRLNPDGSPDSTFGTGGKVVQSFGYNDQIHVLLLQPDGKIVAVGEERGSSAFFATLLVRFNPDGSVDTSFGTAGVLKVTTTAADDAAVLQPDGKIVCGGGDGVGTEADFKLARVNPDGTLDNTFGVGGEIDIDFANSGDGVWGLALQPDGKIVAGGRSRTLGGSGMSDNFAVARLNTDGTLDSSFGLNGKVTTDFATLADFGYAIVLQNDGKIVLAGQAQPQVNDWDFGLVRYNPDGSLDTTFGGGDGKVTTQFGGSTDAAYALKLQTDGKLVAAGIRGPGGFAVARYDANGNLDPTFSSDGKVTTIFEATDQARGLVIQPDGKIVAAGTADGGAILGEFAVARYLGDDTTTLQLNSAVSRKNHRSAGTFDVPLPLVGEPGVECRASNGRQTLVFTFSQPVVSGTASVTGGIGTVSGSPVFSGNTMTVNLINVADVQTLTVTLSNVTDGSTTLPDTSVNMNVLTGDVTGDNIVDTADVRLTKGQIGQPVTQTNFREDVKVSGAIDSADVRIVRSHLGASLP